MLGWVGDVERATLENNTFRTVLYTGKHVQLTVMRLAPGEDIGREAHPHQNNFVMVQVEYTVAGRGKIYAAETLNFGTFVESGDDLAVTGGTGEFENVHGSVHLSLFDPETFQNDIHLLP